MGLDMYIRRDVPTEEPTSYEEWAQWNTIRELAYWRKHPDLHGFIVQTFAKGVDECQKIPLNALKIRRILAASEAGKLPRTEGFFFGSSQSEDREDTRVQLTRILEFLAREPKTKIYYQASW